MKKIEITKTNNNLVKKSENLLFAIHSLSLNASKLFECLIAIIKQNDKDFYEHTFYAKDFKELINSKHKNVIEEMVKAADELLNKKVAIDLSETAILKTHLITTFIYDKELGSYITLKIETKLKPFLLDLHKNYVSYKIENTLSLNSIYSFNLYPILKHQYNQCKPHTKNPFISFEMDLEEFKTIFQIPKTYQLVHIKERILDKAKSEFSEKTDIFFTYELTKKCYKKFDTITFTICKNKKL